MYNINLLHPKETSELDGEKRDIFNKSEKTYKEIILENIYSNNFQNISACMASNVDTFFNKIENFKEDVVQIFCKGLIGGDFAIVDNKSNLQLENEDLILVQTTEGITDVARVEEVGELAKLKGEELGALHENLPKVLRKINFEDIKQLEKNMEDEVEAVSIFHDKIKIHNLEMKLVDVHYQFDRKKLYFFYTADGRVDFRQLAKDLASVFRTRIELRQIGVRDEAKKVGGIGMCGREFCCKSFMTSFKKISTSLANSQNFNISLSKLSGPCGKLKCCLSFETDVEQSN